MEVHVDGFLAAGGEGYAEIMRGVDILENIESGFHVASGRKHDVGG